jgi:hypothetical protein
MTGTWSSSGGNSNYYDGIHHWSNTVGSSVTVSFTGTQIEFYGGTGPGAGIGDVSIDGGTPHEVDFYTPTDQGDVALWASPILPEGHHVFKLSVPGISNPSATDTYVVPDRVNIIDADASYDDRTTGTGPDEFNYIGAWSSSSGNSSYYSGTHTWSNTTNSYVTFSFTGAGVDYYAGVGSGGGIAAVSIDGGPEQNVDTYAASDDGNVLLWHSGPLEYGTHTLKIGVTGTKDSKSVGTWISIDRVDVTSAALSISTPTTSSGTSAGWGKFIRDPVLGKSYGTAFDSSVMYQNGIYKMWFSWRPQSSIAYVQSDDGISWTAPRTVLGPADDYWEGAVNRPSVIWNANLNEYQMWYTGQSDTNSWIGYATSPGGISWTRYSSNPVMSPDQTWEGPAVMNPSVIWNPSLDEYQMWYAAGAQYEPVAIGYATSRDGVNWLFEVSRDAVTFR